MDGARHWPSAVDSWLLTMLKGVSSHTSIDDMASLTSSTCSRTRTSAVPPRPERLMIGLSSQHRADSAVKYGEISTRSAFLRSVSSMPRPHGDVRRRQQSPCPRRTARAGVPASRRCRWPGESHRSNAFQPFTIEGQGRNHPGNRRQDDQQLVDGVEDRLLVFLQITVVRQW